MRSRSPKSNHFFPPNNVSVQVWSQSTHWFRRQSADNKQCRRQRDLHQKQYVPHPLRLGGHKDRELEGYSSVFSPVIYANFGSLRNTLCDEMKTRAAGEPCQISHVMRKWPTEVSCVTRRDSNHATQL